MLNCEDLIEKLQNGYSLPCPKYIDDTHKFSPIELYTKLAHRCFILKPENRADFSEVVKIIEEQLSDEEINIYETTKEKYNERAQKYIRLSFQHQEENGNSVSRKSPL